jgi:rhomboid protease GluP
MEPASANASNFPRVPYMTYIILWINILVFASVLFYDGLTFDRLVLGPKLETLVLFGAKQNGLIAEWQLERLFAPMFLHANLMHLGFNMYAFTQVGKFLEIIMGHRTLLVVYIVAGIVGNIFSFALVPSLGSSLQLFGDQQAHAILSVGASGSLFGILLFLFIIQKYQERLARETGEQEPHTNLAPLIIANGVITFLVPNIDWACHLGGAVAGILLGLAFCFKHAQVRKQYLAAKFLAFREHIPSPSFFHRNTTWIGILALICAGLMTNITRVSQAEKALGQGLLAAAQNPIEEREVDYLAQYQTVLVNPKADTDPNHLLNGALELHKQGKYRTAEVLYLSLSLMHHNKLGSPDFLSSTTATIIGVGYEHARRGQPIPGITPPTNTTNLVLDAEFCNKPGDTFRNLGFMVVAGLLSECAWTLEPKRLDFAADVVAAYWRSNRGRLLFDFLDRMNSAEKHPPLPAGLPLPKDDTLDKNEADPESKEI